jgi:hypothetical protein
MNYAVWAFRSMDECVFYLMVYLVAYTQSIDLWRTADGAILIQLRSQDMSGPLKGLVDRTHMYFLPREVHSTCKRQARKQY